jgi:transcriptional regulator with XRE-family HTH domain
MGWTQEDLSQRSGVGLSTIKDFEKGGRQTLWAIRNQIQRTLEEAGVEFLPFSIRVLLSGDPQLKKQTKRPKNRK